jgi:histidinol-phosphate aminotransferase
VLANGAQAALVTQELLTLGVIVRPLASFGLPHAIRISTGTDEDNQRCVEALNGTSIKEVLLSCSK